jgi:leucyl/phenylalanyl-tRNA--protein transferase
MLDGDALLKIYLAGHFPMWDPESEEVRLYQPDVRGVIDLDRFHVPRRLRDRMRSKPFRLSSDEAFEEAFDQCHVERPDGTWMNPEMRRAYLELFERGFAHSIEAWKDDVLVGGLYGVHIGAAFMGESMFSRPELGGTDASKICLVETVRLLKEGGFDLFDIQYPNPHLKQFNFVEVGAEAFAIRLARAFERPCEW